MVFSDAYKEAEKRLQPYRNSGQVTDCAEVPGDEWPETAPGIRIFLDNHLCEPASMMVELLELLSGLPLTVYWSQ